MSNPSKDNTSIRVHAPPGGQSSNIFSTSEFEQSAANKKKHMGSDIFGANQNTADPAPAKQNRNTGNNIFGADPQETSPSAGTLAGQYKQSQMKSNIFGTDEPATTRTVSDKNRSNIFGVGDNDDPSKRQAGGRRDPNASRMGYNPINGESYNANTKPNGKQAEPPAKPAEQANGNAQASTTANESAPAAPVETANAQTAAPAENASVPTPVTAAAGTTAKETNNGQQGEQAQKNVHTSVRVFHPPGGKSNGPLW